MTRKTTLDGWMPQDKFIESMRRDDPPNLEEEAEATKALVDLGLAEMCEADGQLWFRITPEGITFVEALVKEGTL